MGRSPGILKHLLTEVVGSGPKTACDMQQDQARRAFRAILEQQSNPVTLGAFLLANRWKKNTPEELAAFIEVMHDQAVRVKPVNNNAVDIGANYDGKVHTVLLGVAAGIIAAAVGVPIVVHSGDRIPTKYGCTYTHVLDELGVRTDLSSGESRRMVEETGFGFFYQPRCNPAVHNLLDIRNNMGVRTFLNTIEKLANPAGAPVHLGSFYHLAFAKRVIETLKAVPSYSMERILLFQGLEGYDDVRPGYTKVVERRNGDLHDFDLQTAEYGLHLSREDLRSDRLPEDSAAITEQVLSGEHLPGFTEAVWLNAAVRLYAGDATHSIEQGMAVAQQVIQTGKPIRILQQLREF
ncbi:MAG TPA: anthranilate phosphoribosyltransferase [bacterium]|nr:anthranilate phosphoribosyltransferase [bacterium]